MTEQAEATFSVDEEIGALEGILDKYKHKPGATIPILQELEHTFGYLPEEAVNWIADAMGRPRSAFYGVATFYSQFHMKPRGKNVLTVCCGTACHVKGAEKILTRAMTDLELAEGQDTTPDMKFSLEKVACLGTCSMAPAVLINDKMHGGVKADKLSREIKRLKKAEG